MSVVDMLSLFAVMAALAALPSASVLLVIARAASLGARHGLAVAAGIVLADLLFVAAALLGLSMLADSLGGLFLLIKLLGAAYLIRLGFSLWRQAGAAPPTATPSPATRSLAASFLAGLLLTFGDIKAILFYASLLPLFVDLQTPAASDISALIVITLLAVGGVKSIYALSAQRAARALQARGLNTASRRLSAGLLMGAGGYLVVKS